MIKLAALILGLNIAFGIFGLITSREEDGPKWVKWTVRAYLFINCLASIYVIWDLTTLHWPQ